MFTPTDLSVFPISTKIDPSGCLTIAGHDLEQLANTYATPLYIYDGATLRGQITRLQELFKKHYAGEAAVAYAVKAYFSYFLAKKLAGLNLGADVVSLGEIHLAQKAGFSRQAIHLHGNNKTQGELQAALDWNIQAIVVDNLEEMSFLEELAEKAGKRARIWLRITPDLKVNTHPHIETSNSNSKFGLHIQNGQASQAIRQALASPWLDLVGLHTHLGSQIFEPEPYSQAIAMLFALAERENFVPQEISPGGGWGVRYTENETRSSDAEPWVQAVCGTVEEQCMQRGWPLPKIILEPGRWIVAQAGTAVYRVGCQKDTPQGAHIVAVDGGMADNPRVALYQAEYTARLVSRAGAQPVLNSKIVGKFCESGDVLIPEITLPKMKRGDLLAIPAAGAYQLSMASNYNFATRPAVLWLEENSVEVMQPRELPDQPGWWVNEPC
jgi:diaminopimelate decarboxylase